METPPTRVALLDEYPLWLNALTEGLEAQAGLLVTLVALTGGELLRSLTGQQVDVLVLEPWLRSGDGLEAVRHVRTTMPGTTVVAYSRIWDDRHVQPVMDLGAAAYVPKTTPVAGLRSIIAGARNGLVTLPRAVPTVGPVPALTPREAEVLGLVADGHSNDDVARQIFVTERTVRFHLRNIYAKLGATNRTMAVAVARKAGIIP